MKCPKCGYNSFEYYGTCKRCSSDLSVYKQTHNITSMILPPEAREREAAEYRSASPVDEQPVESVGTDEDMFSFDLPGSAIPSSELSPNSVLTNDDPFNFNFDDDLDKTVPEQTNAEVEAVAALPESPTMPNEDPFNFDDDLPDDILQQTKVEVEAVEPPPASSALLGDDPFNFDDDLQRAVPAQSKVEDGGLDDLLETNSQSYGDPFAPFSATPSAPPEEAEPKKPGLLDDFDLENFSWDDTPVANAKSVEPAPDDFDSPFGEIADSTKK